jgi:cobalt/nickel transport system permease protein
MAHIPDGFLSPGVIAGTTAASAAALALAARRSRNRLGEGEAPLLGAMTAFVFAAQMLNFPLGAGTSAHLLGGVMVGVLVGPWSGMLVMFSVILVQALLFQDGGIAALGANTLNMAVLGAGVGYAVYRFLHTLLGEGRLRLLSAAAVAAWLSAVLVGVAAALELAISGTVPLGPALVAVGGSHLLVGIGEAVITGAVLGLVLRTRPELLPARTSSRAARILARSILATALLLAVAGVYLASSRPDALEAAAEQLGITGTARGLLDTPFSDYSAPVGGPWIAGVLGVVVVFLVGWGAARALRPRSRA